MDEKHLLAVLQRDIAERLRSVCKDMSEGEFEQLVRDIAAVNLKYGPDSLASVSLKAKLDDTITEERNPRNDSASA